jgi:endonuclease/exonuclease/phosphatase family metal-dependent hydrolase
VSTLRVLSYNICRGGRGKEEPLCAAIAEACPDVVVLQEATDPAVVKRLAAGTGMAQWASGRGDSLGFMSRRPVRHYQWHRPRISRHAFLEIQPGPGELRVFGVHLSALYAAWTERRRVFELRALLAAITRHQHGFHVLTGDFNTVAPGDLLDFRLLPSRLRALVWLSGGSINWKTIQLILDAGYTDGYRTLHRADPGYTFPTWSPHVRLDYVFVPTAFAARLERCAIVKSAAAVVASDHFPFLSEVNAESAL